MRTTLVLFALVPLAAPAQEEPSQGGGPCPRGYDGAARVCGRRKAR